MSKLVAIVCVDDDLAVRDSLEIELKRLIFISQFPLTIINYPEGIKYE